MRRRAAETIGARHVGKLPWQRVGVYLARELGAMRRRCEQIEFAEAATCCDDALPERVGGRAEAGDRADPSDDDWVMSK